MYVVVHLARPSSCPGSDLVSYAVGDVIVLHRGLIVYIVGDNYRAVSIYRALRIVFNSRLFYADVDLVG